MKNFVKLFRASLKCFAFLFLAGSFYQFPAQDDGTKGIIPEEAGIKNRPPARLKNRRRPQTIEKFTYRTTRKFIPVKPLASQEVAQLGVTLWRFRPATTADKTKELIDEETEKKTQEWTLERFETNDPVKIGEKLRIGIESLSRSGFLYVIDRELYADGTTGTPHLIFPTTRIRQGNNFVRPGDLLYLPPPPRYFKIQQSRTDKQLVSEILTIIVSPQPLKLPADIGEKPMTLETNLASKWETDWKTNFIQMDLEGGAGRTLTPEEKLSGDGNSKDLIDESERLTQDDAPPQTVFVSLINSANPFLITVFIHYGK